MDETKPTLDPTITMIFIGYLLFLVGPNAHSFMLEKLFHPIIVASVLEESQELKVGVVQMTVHLGTTPTAIIVMLLSILAGRTIPSLSGPVPILVFSDSTTLIV
jgi:hypothetical protein